MRVDGFHSGGCLKAGVVVGERRTRAKGRQKGTYLVPLAETKVNI